MARMSKAIRLQVSDASPSLPEDMVAEILSWLPVESLLRFKCVCKRWRQLIQQDDDFVEKYHRRAAMRFYCQKECINQPTIWRVGMESPIRKRQFSCIDIQKGLMLEHERHDDPTERLRIRNPVTRQTLYLPDLRVGNEPPTWVVARMFFSRNECTVISFSESEESVLFGRFRALTVGVDTTWRPLKNSPPDSIYCIGSGRRPPEIYALSIENVFHVLTIDDANNKRILSVDVKGESIKTAKIPENLFSDWSDVMPREWDSKLSLFCDDGDQVNIWVLVNYDKNEWAKTQIVNLETFIQDYPIPFITEERKICNWGINGKRWAVIWCQEESLSVPWCKNELSIKPTILQLKGMKSEKVEEAIGTGFWKEKDMPTTTSQIVSLISLIIKSVI